MQTTNKHLLLLLLSITIFNSNVLSQEKRSGELGVALGGSYYLGEINKIPFVGTRPAVGVLYRHTFDTRLAITGNFTYGRLAGNAKPNSYYQYDGDKSFNSSFYELSAVGEFNFIPFLPGKKKYVYTPYIFAGVSEIYYKRDNYLYKFIFSIPFGVGVKYNINTKFIFGAFIGMRKTFFDYMDYKPRNNDKQVYYAGNKDWYSVFGVSLSYKIKYNAKCPAFD